MSDPRVGRVSVSGNHSTVCRRCVDDLGIVVLIALVFPLRKEDSRYD